MIVKIKNKSKQVKDLVNRAINKFTKKRIKLNKITRSNQNKILKKIKLKMI